MLFQRKSNGNQKIKTIIKEIKHSFSLRHAASGHAKPYGGMHTGCTGFPGHSSHPLPAAPDDAPALPEHIFLLPCTSHTTAAVPAAQHVPCAMQQCGTAPCVQGCGRTGCTPGLLPSDAPRRTVRLSDSGSRDACMVSRVFAAYFSPPIPFPGNRKALTGFTLQRLRCHILFCGLSSSTCPV